MIDCNPVVLAWLGFLALASSGSAAFADDPPAVPSRVVAQPVREIELRFDRSLRPIPATEIPPPILVGGWTALFLTTSYSWMCSTPRNILTNPPIDVTRYCDYAQWPDDRPPPSGQFVSPGQLDGSRHPWKRNYSGIFSAQVIPEAKFGQEIVAIVHGENKNEVDEDRVYQNTVNPSPPVSKCFSGYHDGKYEDCYESYNAFISVSTAPYSERFDWGRGHFRDDGPAIWPSAGYVTAEGKKISDGVRHPSSIVADGYLYIFYLDGGTWFADVPGRNKGIKVARAPLPATGAPSGFTPYFQGRFDPGNPSLPKGFDAAEIARFYAVQGGAADKLYDDSDRSFRFSVAHVRGTSSYAGVDEFCDSYAKPHPICEIRIRLSKDLVHWGPPATIESTVVSSWQAERLHYPEFMDSAASTNSEIDADDFWLLGTSTDYKLQAMRLRMAAPGP